MALLYKMEIKESKINGKGLYSLEDIPKGAVYWAWEHPDAKPLLGQETKPNVIYTRQELESIQDPKLMEKVLHCGFYYADADIFIDLNDGTEFTNHSNDWNSQIIYDESKDYRKMTCIARKAIKAGEELTAYYGNYMSTNAKWVDDLMVKYNPSRKDIELQVEMQGNKALTWKLE